VISVYQLPQRFQLVNGLSGLDAGVRLIPFTLASPIGTGFAATISGRFKIPPIWIILTGAGLQVIGFALLGTLPITTNLTPSTYGFEIIAGFGCGMNLALLFTIVPQVTEKRDRGKPAEINVIEERSSETDRVQLWPWVRRANLE
jgi:hypothetical protein